MRKSGLSHGLPYATRVYKYCLIPYNLLHNSEWVPYTTVVVCSPRLAIFGKNGFLLFTAYSASVERWKVRDLVLALRCLPCADVVN